MKNKMRSKSGKKLIDTAKGYRVRSAAVTFSLILLSLLTCISASRICEMTFMNHFSTGSVAIDLRQMQINAEGEIVEAEPSVVMPGDHVSYMPEVENLRADAYVRVRVDIRMDRETEAPVTTSDVFSLTDGWVQKGDYFYNTRIMKKGETGVAFRGIVIPGNWVQDPDKDLPAAGPGVSPAQSSGFTISVHADAIQSENFSPDFGSDMPWGAVTTETAKATDNTSYGTADPMVVRNELNITGAGGLEANTKDLFGNFGIFMAGEEYTDTLTIKNEASYEVMLYFRTKADKTDLTGQMQLDISLDGDSLYRGTLRSEPLSKYVQLIGLRPGEKAKLKYTVRLPDESRNCYSVLADDVEWQFRIAAVSPAGITNGGTSNEADGGYVMTGDSSRFDLWLTAFAFSVMLIGMIACRCRGSKLAASDDDDHEQEN